MRLEWEQARRAEREVKEKVAVDVEKGLARPGRVRLAGAGAKAPEGEKGD